LTDSEFDNRILTLIFLVGTDGAEDQFAEEYEALLGEVKASTGPRFEKFARMKKLLLHQACFLMCEWLKEKKETTVMDKNDKREIIQ